MGRFWLSVSAGAGFAGACFGMKNARIGHI